MSEPISFVALRDGEVSSIDASDLAFISQWQWRLDNGYAIRRETVNGKVSTIRMHREITNCPQGQCVDHINGNRLDNRRENLRICTTRQNQQNKHFTKRNGKSSQSQFKGVSMYVKKGLWRARIKAEGKCITLGYFRDELSAARAYDLAALKHFGEFARPNFPHAP